MKEMDVPQPKYLLCALTTQAARHLTAYYNRAMRPFGITARQMMALAVLSYEDNISLGRFAERAEIGKAAAVTMIKRLETMGLVRIKPNADDARLNNITLTSKAKALTPEIFKVIQKLEKEFEAAITAPKAKDLVEMLHIVRQLQVD